MSEKTVVYNTRKGWCRVERQGEYYAVLYRESDANPTNYLHARTFGPSASALTKAIEWAEYIANES